jgi:hypothetical protein
MSDQPSNEQAKIIDAIVAGRHVVCTAKPGTGKTKMAMFLTQRVQDMGERVLVLSYNRRLVDGTVTQIDDLPQSTTTAGRELSIKHNGKPHQAFTYHGLASSITGEIVNEDVALNVAVAKMKADPSLCLAWTGCNDFGVLVIDEGQDMRPSYYELVRLLLMFAHVDPTRVRLVVTGDPRQLLYNFFSRNNADERFVTKADVLLAGINDRPWEHHQLTRSYRATPPIANVVNALLAVGAAPSTTVHKMVSARSTSVTYPPVTMLLVNVYQDLGRIATSLFRDHKPEEIFVLVGSTGGSSPIVTMINAIANRRWGRDGSKLFVHVANTSDNHGSTSGLHDVTANKILATTFHSVKGLERKLVIVVNYRHLFGADMENSLYVALTRASEKLVIVQDTRSVTKRELDQFASLVEDTDVVINLHRALCKKYKSPRARNGVPKKIDVYSLFSFTSSESLSKLYSLVDNELLHDGTLDLATRYRERNSTKSEHEETKIDVDAVDLDPSEMMDKMMCALYDDLTITTHDEETDTDRYTDTLGMIRLAFEFALEYYVTDGRIPHRVTKTMMALIGSRATASDTACSTADCLAVVNTAKAELSQLDAISRLLERSMDLIATPRVAGDDDITSIQRRLPTFVALAACVRASTGYRHEMVHLSSFEFVIVPSVFVRLEMMLTNFDRIRALHLTTSATAKFVPSCSTHFTYIDDKDEKSHKIKITCSPTIKTANYVVYLVSTPSLSSADTIRAAAMAQVSDVARCYVLNVLTGRLTRVKVRTDAIDEFWFTALQAKITMETPLTDRQFTEKYGLTKVQMRDARASRTTAVAAIRTELDMLDRYVDRSMDSGCDEDEFDEVGDTENKIEDFDLGCFEDDDDDEDDEELLLEYTSKANADREFVPTADEDENDDGDDEDDDEPMLPLSELLN